MTLSRPLVYSILSNRCGLCAQLTEQNPWFFVVLGRVKLSDVLTCHCLGESQKKYANLVSTQNQGGV
jgi:hypothetical protein